MFGITYTNSYNVLNVDEGLLGLYDATILCIDWYGISTFCNAANSPLVLIHRDENAMTTLVWCLCIRVVDDWSAINYLVILIC